jgi:hypothetical protein
MSIVNDTGGKEATFFLHGSLPPPETFGRLVSVVPAPDTFSFSFPKKTNPYFPTFTI